ncbi:DUF4365 domain-containing protein [Streptomyces lydicus]
MSGTRTQPLPGQSSSPDSQRYDKNQHRGDFGEQFVRSLAVAARLTAGKSQPDITGDDWTLGYPGRLGATRFPRIDVQVKCWGSPKGNDHEWRYPMKVPHYNLLAGTGFTYARFLFLVITPKDPAEWIDITPERLMLRHAAYWACFHDKSELGENEEDPQHAHTVSVPKANLLTVESLRDLFAERFRVTAGGS